MSKSFFKAGLLAYAALKGSLMQESRVNGLGLSSQNKVMRIDLERKIINHYENL